MSTLFLYIRKMPTPYSNGYLRVTKNQLYANIFLWFINYICGEDDVYDDPPLDEWITYYQDRMVNIMALTSSINKVSMFRLAGSDGKTLLQGKYYFTFNSEQEPSGIWHIDIDTFCRNTYLQTCYNRLPKIDNRRYSEVVTAW